MIDRRALRTPDLVVADTEANAEFLAEVGDLPRERVQVCLVGAEDRLFHAGGGRTSRSASSSSAS